MWEHFNKQLIAIKKPFAAQNVINDSSIEKELHDKKDDLFYYNPIIIDQNYWNYGYCCYNNMNAYNQPQKHGWQSVNLKNITDMLQTHRWFPEFTFNYSAIQVIN